MSRRQSQKEQHMVRAKRILCLIVKESQLRTCTDRLQGKQQVQSDGERQTQTQNRESSVTTHVPSQPMDLSDMSARVRLNMKRSPFEVKVTDQNKDVRWKIPMKMRS